MVIGICFYAVPREDARQAGARPGTGRERGHAATGGESGVKPKALACLCSVNLSSPNCSVILSSLNERRTDGTDPQGGSSTAPAHLAREFSDHPGAGRRSYARAEGDVVQCLDGSWRVYVADRLVATTPAPPDPGQFRARKERCASSPRPGAPNGVARAGGRTFSLIYDSGRHTNAPAHAPEAAQGYNLLEVPWLRW